MKLINNNNFMTVLIEVHIILAKLAKDGSCIRREIMAKYLI